MKYTILLFTLILSAIACQKEIDQLEMEQENIEPEHHVLKDIIDHLPFDQFNDFTKAIFRNSAGVEISFLLSIDEEVVEKQSDEGIFTTNEITFKYENPVSFEIPNFSVVASFEYFEDLEFKEVIICNTIDFAFFVALPKLTIIPNQDYKNTILNEEFLWLGEEYMNVYSNILIQENDSDKTKIFYQSPVGIIGFVDNSNNSWVLDRFE